MKNLPTYEEFVNEASEERAWPLIKKLINPDMSAADEDGKDDPDEIVYKNLKLGDFIQVWSEYFAYEDHNIDMLKVAPKITDAIIKAMGTGVIAPSKIDLTLSGAEDRSFHIAIIPYILHNWDGISLFVHKSDIKKFESLCKNIKYSR